MERSILHCDMNNFYASVERLYDKGLVGVPVAVCGDEEARHGIVLAKSEEAKRFGVVTGDTIWMAKSKCPELRIVSPHFDRYVKYSRLAKELYGEYTDLVESFGLDECWLDVTASRLAFGDGVKIGEEIRTRVRKEMGLTISVGVSFNKVLAKLGSDMKKPDALTHLPKDTFFEKIKDLPVESILGVGRKSAEIFHLFGIHTIGALSQANDRFLKLKFGKNGEMLKKYALGEDTSPVLPLSCEPLMKSVGHGMTFSKDLTTSEEVWTSILALTQEVGEKLRFHKKKAMGIAIECKDKNFFTKTLQKRLAVPTDCTMTLAKEAFSLFSARYLFREPIRAISIRAIDLEKVGEEQLSIFTEKEDLDLRAEKLDRVTDQLSSRYGKGTLILARLMDCDFSDDHEGYVPFH
ncbi:MAG: DNA polymerase IV [Clostridia bacterium]|nr:DNA polymerase IV [Clostridia bacterium]